MNNNICKPISLNCFKHHSGFIAEQLHSIKNPGDFEKLLKSLVLTGNAQMDLYTGTITPHEISKYIIDFLESKKILNSKKYIDWLATKKNNYFIVGLPDQSKWVLLKGKEKERYVHLHPARYSDHSIRISASSLKTAIASAAYSHIHHLNPLDKSLINHVRKTFLDLPEIKTFLPDSSSCKLIHEFIKEIE